MDSAGWYWNTHGCNELADVNMFGAITKKINGGYNGAKERLAAYVRNKKTLGIV
jgi:putative chitinase